MNATSSNAPLALRFNAPAAFGSNEEMNAIVERMEVLIPTRLAEWQTKPGYIEKAQKAINNAFYKTAQLAIFYRLVPGQDIHVLPFGNDFAVDMGIEAWRKAADRYCSTHNITYHIHVEEMPLDELKARRGNNYHPDDVGAVAYLWRSDKENVYKIFGPKESMSRACGVWAKKAKEVNGKWQEDNIPAQRTKQDVAKRRAMKAVLKLEFSLDSLLAATPAELRDNIQVLDRDIRTEERRQSVPAQRGVDVDEDGFIVVEPTRRPTVNDVQFVVAEEEVEEPDVDEITTEQPQGDATDASVDYLALTKKILTLTAKLTGTAASFASWTKSTHLKSNGPASVEQYRFLVGILNGITGDKQSYRDLLGVMVGRYVNSEDRPGVLMVVKLLEWLRVDYVDEVTGEKIANPQYRADYADAIKDMWQAIKGAA